MQWIILGIIVIVGIFLISAYNGLVAMRNKVKEAFATMDVYMKKRFDLIPNLVETVKGYASHEKETLENVIKARNSAMGATGVDAMAAGEKGLTTALKSLFALAESYPDLKANQNFLSLQAQLEGVEGEIANSRKYYNAVVRDYNTKRQTFPTVMVAGMFGFQDEKSFEISGDERQNVSVKF